jgi:hypothetical protein
MNLYDVLAGQGTTHFERLFSQRLAGGGKTQTLTGIPPLSFKANGKPLISWSMLGNGEQTGTPSSDNIIMPDFCGVRTAQLIPFPYKSTSGTITGVTVEVSTNGRIKATGTTTGGYNWYLQNASMSLPAGTYTVSFVGKINGVNLRLRDVASAVQVAIVGGEVKSQTFTLSEDCSDLRIYLNTGQTGADVDCDFVAMLNLGSTALPYEPYGWAEKITCAGQTVPVYLGEVPTVRKIKKLVFDGSEPWALSGSIVYIYSTDIERLSPLICTHFPNVQNSGMWNGNNWIFQVDISNLGMTGRDAWIAYLQQQHAAGTPVTVWYVLATPTTGIVNEPLAKIGDYADELSSTDAAVTIPTAKGDNTLTVDTTVQPSEMTIRYKA